MKIEKGIAIPDGKVRVVWPHAEMEVNDSFLTDRKLALVCNVNVRYGKKLGRKYTARKVEDGVRVWRVL